MGKRETDDRDNGEERVRHMMRGNGEERVRQTDNQVGDEGEGHQMARAVKECWTTGL